MILSTEILLQLKSGSLFWTDWELVLLFVNCPCIKTQLHTELLGYSYLTFSEFHVATARWGMQVVSERNPAGSSWSIAMQRWNIMCWQIWDCSDAWWCVFQVMLCVCVWGSGVKSSTKYILTLRMLRKGEAKFIHANKWWNPTLIPRLFLLPKSELNDCSDGQIFLTSPHSTAVQDISCPKHYLAWPPGFLLL